MELKTNTIYKGDAYEMIKEIPDKSIDLIYTDIPYLIAHHGYCGNSPLGQRLEKREDELKGRKEQVQKRIDELKQKMENATTTEEYEKWHCQHSNLLNKLNLITDQDITNGIDYKILDEFVRIQPYIYIYIWCSKEQIYDLLKFFVGKHHCNFNLLVWCKTNSVPATNDTWLPNIEHCLVFKQKGAPRYNDGYELKSKWYVSSTNKDDKEKYNHPTIKPLELVKRHILHSTKENDIVFDPFMGSGTTCLAAKQLNRRYIGFEINDKYFNIAKDRLNGIDQKGQIDLFDSANVEQMKLF